MKLGKLYDYLLAHSDPAIDLAVAAALPTAEPTRRAALAELLWARRHPPAAAALIVHFDLLPGDLRRRIVAQIGDLGPILAAASRTRDARAAGRIVRWLRVHRLYPMAYLLVDLLCFGPPPVRGQAGECLLAFVQDVDAEQVEPAAAAGVVKMLGEAVDQFTRHRQPAVLRAAALLGMLLNRPDFAPEAVPTPLLRGVLHLIEHDRSRETTAELLNFLALPALKASAGAAIIAAVKAGRWNDLLARGEALRSKPVSQACGRISGARTLLPDTAAIATMDAIATRHLPAWIAATSPETDRSFPLLTALAKHPDAVTRIAALRHIAREHRRLSSPELALAARGLIATAQAIITQACHDPHPAIARWALSQMLRTTALDLSPLLLLLATRSPHEQVRRLAARHAAPAAFAALWDRWPRLPHAHRIAAARAAIKLDDDFHARLAARLDASDEAGCLRALDMIAQLNQGLFFKPRLVQFARGPQPKLAATAIKALATLESPEIDAILEASLTHSDSRVRANAVDALEARRLSPSIVPRLRTMAADEDNRPRASAAAVLLKNHDAEGARQLDRMLADPRAPHRISALWLAQHAGRIPAAAAVAEAAVTDPRDDVRRKARRTLGELIGLMRRPLPASAGSPASESAAAERNQ